MAIRYKVVERKNPKTEEPIFFAQTVDTQPVKLTQIAERLTSYTTLTRTDILAVISALEENIIQHLQQGQGIRFGMLGSISCFIKSSSAATEKGFTRQNIRGLSVSYKPAATIKYQLGIGNPMVKFERVD